MALVGQGPGFGLLGSSSLQQSAGGEVTLDGSGCRERNSYSLGQNTGASFQKYERLICMSFASHLNTNSFNAQEPLRFLPRPCFFLSPGCFFPSPSPPGILKHPADRPSRLGLWGSDSLGPAQPEEPSHGLGEERGQWGGRLDGRQICSLSGEGWASLPL